MGQSLQEATEVEGSFIGLILPGSDLDRNGVRDVFTGRDSHGNKLDFIERYLHAGSYLGIKGIILCAEAILVYKTAEIVQESGLFDIYSSGFFPHF